jgi:hypothetical protein
MGSVPPLLTLLLMVVSGWVHRRRLIVIEFLQAQNRLLKERLSDYCKFPVISLIGMTSAKPLGMKIRLLSEENSGLKRELEGGKASIFPVFFPVFTEKHTEMILQWTGSTASQVR